MWGTEGVSKELQNSSVFSYMPLERLHYGAPDVIFGTSDTNIQGTMVVSGTIIVSGYIMNRWIDHLDAIV